MRALTQSTLREPCHFDGVGVHTGHIMRLSVLPAPPSTGILFVRVDQSEQTNIIHGLHTHVFSTNMSTVLKNAFDVSIATVEHLMAALAGEKITNAIVEIDGPEMPIMDGSSMPFTRGLKASGRVDQLTPARIITVQRTVRVEELAQAMIDGSNGFVELSPYEGCLFDVTFDFNGRFTDTMPYQKHYRFDMARDSFAEHIANARTFGLYEDETALRQKGLIKGVSLDNTVVFKNMNVINPEGLRSLDECVRHKILDAIGDLALAGGVIVGCYKGHNTKHSLNNQILTALFADPANYRIH